jgi:hypothetical protein
MRILPLSAAALLGAAPIAAQENYEIQVYPSQTATKRTTLFELHSNFTTTGSRGSQGAVAPTNRALHETLEITHGFSNIFEVGFYIFSSKNFGDGLEFVGTHLRPRIRVPESLHWPVGLSLSTEFGYQRTKYDENQWGIEVRPIVDQTVGALYWAFNPNVEWAWRGPGAGKGIDGMNFNPSVKLALSLHPKLSAGLEYYGGTGTLTRTLPSDQQHHMLYPTLDFFLAEEWELNVGYGLQLAGNGDRNIIKVIVGRRFPF